MKTSRMLQPIESPAPRHLRDETASQRDKAAQKRDELATRRDREADIADRQVLELAEGVETTEQAAILEGMGCRRGQGFLWSKPLAPAEATASLGLASASAAVAQA
jgi:sensor c-di-GMP phosphodiesterase-like protein